jgi:hypothetical protein
MILTSAVINFEALLLLTQIGFQQFTSGSVF